MTELEERAKTLLGDEYYSKEGVRDCFRAMITLRGFHDVSRILDRLEFALGKTFDTDRTKDHFIVQLFDDFAG